MSPELARVTVGMALAIALPLLAVWDCLGIKALDRAARWLVSFIYLLMVVVMVATSQWPQAIMLLLGAVTAFASDIERGVKRVFANSV